MFEQNSHPSPSASPRPGSGTSRTALVSAVFALTGLAIALVYQGTRTNTSDPSPRATITESTRVDGFSHTQDVLVEGPVVSALIGEIQSPLSKSAEAMPASAGISAHRQDVLVEGPLVSASLDSNFTVSRQSPTAGDYGQDVLIEGPFISAFFATANGADASD